jgi:hypothetical protein
MLEGEGSIFFSWHGAVMSKATSSFPATLEREPALSFAREHFGGADLGHVKRNACLLRVAEKICRHPGGTLPHKLANPADYKAMDGLMNRPEVTHASVLAPHLRRTRERIEASKGVVLIVHDTTELDYSGLSIPELGPIGNGRGRGYLCHNSLAVDPERKEVLGLAHQILHHRVPAPVKEGIKAKRERQSRESRLWSQAALALGETPAGVTVVDVADRGADIFEFLATENKLRRTCLVRARHNRLIRVGHDGTGKKIQLFKYLRSLPAQGHKTKSLVERSTGQDRQMKLAISWAAVALEPPKVRQGNYEEKPLAVWGLRLWELAPPKEQTPLEWFLLSTEPVTTLQAAWQRSSWYECRYMVEEYHKGQKTGCAIERMQFETEQALQPMIALLSVVTVLLLNLRLACRQPDAETRKASTVVDPQYEEILRAWRYKTPRAEMTVKEFFMALARLGGHMNRKSDGNPGWLVLWRGWMDLQSMLAGAEAERRRQKKCRVT